MNNLSEQEVLPIGEIISGFYAYLNFTRLSSHHAVLQTILRGIKEGKFGYTAVFNIENGGYQFPDPDLIYFAHEIRADEVDLDHAVLISGRIAEELTRPEPVIVEETPQPVPSDNGNTGMVSSPVPSPSEPGSLAGRTQFTLRATADKEKIFKVFRVIQNLVEKSQHMNVHIEVCAEAISDFDPVWLRNAVEEPLDEADIDAQTLLE